MIPASVRSEILRRIALAEAEHDVHVLLAIESGSRAWGFESPNSDFDARFIYAHPKEWYLSVGLDGQRDVIEYPIVDEIDLNGWDIRKALRLFWKSNPAFVEWIQSPIIYVQRGTFLDQARTLLPEIYSCERGIHHYRSMAKTNFRGYLKADRVPLKKYFYVLRPLLSVRWIERYASAPPIEFSGLLHLIENDQPLVIAIRALLDLKRRSPELGDGPAIIPITQFVERELERLEALSPPADKRPELLPKLNAIFVSSIQRA